MCISYVHIICTMSCVLWYILDMYLIMYDLHTLWYTYTVPVYQLYYIHVYPSCVCVSFWNVFLSSEHPCIIYVSHIYLILCLPKKSVLISLNIGGCIYQTQSAILSPDLLQPITIDLVFI